MSLSALAPVKPLRLATVHGAALVRTHVTDNRSQKEKAGIDAWPSAPLDLSAFSQPPYFSLKIWVMIS